MHAATQQPNEDVTPEEMFNKPRVEAFSDGVFAVAITLLVLDIKVPEGLASGALFPALTSTSLGVQYLAYAVSFLTIGVMWVSHHRLMAIVRVVDHGLLYRNIFLLGVVSFIPFPTSILSNYVNGEGSGGGNMQAAVGLYGAAMVLLSIAFTLMWGQISFNPALRQSWVNPAAVRRDLLQSASAIVIFGAATAFDLVAPMVSLTIYAFVIVALATIRPKRVRYDRISTS